MIFSKYNDIETAKEIHYLVPNSANKKANKCLGWRCNLKQKYIQFIFQTSKVIDDFLISH